MICSNQEKKRPYENNSCNIRRYRDSPEVHLLENHCAFDVKLAYVWGGENNRQHNLTYNINSLKQTGIQSELLILWPSHH